MYIFTKISPVPIDSEFFISETREQLRPTLFFFKTYQETVVELNRRIMDEKATISKELGSDGILEEGSDEDQVVGMGTKQTAEATQEIESRLLDDPEFSEVGVQELNDDEFYQDEEEEDDEEIGENDDPEALHENPEEIARNQNEADFEREFSRLMNESADSRRSARKITPFDVSIPSRLKQTDPVQDGKVAFTLLTRRGNKQQGKLMALPSDSSFAITNMSKQKAERHEREQMKELVLDYEERERLAHLHGPLPDAPAPHSAPPQRGIPRRGRGRGGSVWKSHYEPR